MAAVPDDDTRNAMDIERIRAQIMKLMAETEEIHQRIAQTEQHMWWYPVVIAGGIFSAGAAIIGIAIKVFS